MAYSDRMHAQNRWQLTEQPGHALGKAKRVRPALASDELCRWSNTTGSVQCAHLWEHNLGRFHRLGRYSTVGFAATYWYIDSNASPSAQPFCYCFCSEGCTTCVGPHVRGIRIRDLLKRWTVLSNWLEPSSPSYWRVHTCDAGEMEWLSQFTCIFYRFRFWCILVKMYETHCNLKHEQLYTCVCSWCYYPFTFVHHAESFLRWAAMMSGSHNSYAYAYTSKTKLRISSDKNYIPIWKSQNSKTVDVISDLSSLSDLLRREHQNYTTCRFVLMGSFALKLPP
jgi:hypothetical protein